MRHMIESIGAIFVFIKNKERSSLDKNRLLLSAIIRELEIIGEAAGQISDETRKRFQELPWRQIIAMRNRLIHAYFDVNHDVVWKTIKDHLPDLRDKLEKVISILEKV